MKCRLCQRKAEEKDGLCRRHLKAKEVLRNNYKKWREAYSSLSWSEYLKRVKELKGTGEWVKEVIELEGMEKLD